jgi:ABC-type transport system involved in multi-copper enzyme maturation permease subunit
VRRSSIVMGKFLSQATLLTGLMAISTILMVIVAKALNADFTLGTAAIVLGKLLVAGVVSVLAYEALTSLCSALTRQSGVSLLLNVGVMFVIWFLSIISTAFRPPHVDVAFDSFEQFKPESYAAYLKYISVWTYNQDLLHPSAARFFSATMVHLGYGLLFLGLAHLVLRKRDI